MSDEYANQIAALRYSVQRLIARYEREQHEREALTAELKRKQSDLLKANADLYLLQKKYDNLRLIRALPLNDEEQTSIRRRLSRMMREIDKCIDLLNQ